LGHTFWGAVASHRADLVLLLEILLGVGLFVGARLARLGRFRQHAWCQSFVVLLNAPILALLMIPSFSVQVYPRIPARLDRSFYALATAHGALGSLAEIAALYILLSAGTNALPKKFRIANYKVWMRAVLALWWIALLLGIATYIRWYVPLSRNAPSSTVSLIRHWFSIVPLPPVT
jgi:hypothetical protein